MSQAWGYDQSKPKNAPIGLLGGLFVLCRGVFVGVVTYSCLGLLLLLRLIEAPLFGAKRPMTPWITQFVCRTAFRGMGMGFKVTGRPMRFAGAIVANHVSWLDIFALNAPQRVYFVSKSEVARWPGIGWLARATGTVFIARRSAEAEKQRRVFRERLTLGHRLVFFPEGTSSDGVRVLPFKSTLFAAFFDSDLISHTFIQPVTLAYHAPKNADPRFYGWWADMSFGPHLTQILGVRRPGYVHVIFHDPVAVRNFTSRKQLSHFCEATIRQGLLDDLPAASMSDQTSAGVAPVAR